jgi:hypothetical protein
MNQSPAGAERIRNLAAEISAAGAGQNSLDGNGRGLVIVAGGTRIFTNAYVLLYVLRQVLHSRLPTELWYFGQVEISPAMAAVIEPLDVRLVDATPLIASTGANIRDGWQLKSFALVHSRFAEVLLLDADQVPISDPAACFDWPQYLETGAVFWPDVIDLRKENAIWQLMGLEPRRTVSFESGQLLVDRRRHSGALAAALRLNEAADDVYQLIYGDKDTYLLAWQLIGAPYTLVPYLPYRDEFMMVQRDFSGNTLFQHRTNAKWQYGAEQRKIFGFQYEDACLAALAELQRQWSGHAFTAPDRSSKARAIEQELLEVDTYIIEIASEPRIRVQLRPHAEIGEGRASDRRHWWIEEVEGSIRLVLSGGEQCDYTFERGADQIWRGRRHRPPAVDLSLYPAGGAGPVVRSNSPGLVDELLRASGALSGRGDDPRRLAEALALLSKVVPGVSHRILHLADTEVDPETSGYLRRLALDLGEECARTEVDRSPTWEVGYVRAEIPE